MYRDAALTALWDISTPDGADRRFRDEQFQSLPEKFKGPVAAKYRERFNSAGIFDANQFLLTTVDSLDSAAWRVSSSDDDLCLWAKTRAREFSLMRAQVSDEGKAYLVLAEGCRRRGIAPPIPERDKTIAGAIARMCDELWWRRQVRKVHARRVERSAIGLGLVHSRAGLYASDETVERRRDQRSRNRQMLEAMLAINEQGQEYTLQQLADLSVSNPVIRRGELMTRMAGFEQVAERLGHVGEFYTITCPSRMHARHSRSGEVNESYDGTTPGEAQKYLCKTWGKCRAALRRRGIRPYGFRVAEPHHDGTPHWHLLLFMPAGEYQACRDVLGRYALQDSPTELGAKKHRFTAVQIDPAKGTAAGYLAKYVAKNIDAYGIDRVDEDLTGKRNPHECAARVDAWASCWGIRQFQQIGGPPVTVWRELRRRVDELPDSDLEDIRYAADNGAWDRFTELMGGPTAPRDVMPVKLDRMDSSKPGRYGEYYPVIVGLQTENIFLKTRVHQWRVGRGRKSQNQDFFERSPNDRCRSVVTDGALQPGRRTANLPGAGSEIAFRDSIGDGQADMGVRTTAGDYRGSLLAFSGASAPPWSSVNNCTGQSFDGDADDG